MMADPTPLNPNEIQHEDLPLPPPAGAGVKRTLRWAMTVIKIAARLIDVGLRVTLGRDWRAWNLQIGEKLAVSFAFYVRAEEQAHRLRPQTIFLTVFDDEDPPV